MALLSKSLRRRDFLKVCSAAAAATAVAGAAGAKAYAAPASSTGHDTVASDTAIIEERGEWLPIHCCSNCNSMCLNMGYVVDGTIIRQKTDDAHEDSMTHPQQRSCLRGHSWRQMVYNTDRIKYPMKRKNWQPGGVDFHGELRGKDEWERISWDEALDLVASELSRIYEAYGPRSVINNAWNWDSGTLILKAMGGCITNSETESFDTYPMVPNHIGMFSWGDHPDIMMANDRHDLENADYIVFYSCNPCWAQTGGAPHFYNLAQEKGVEFVYVGPSRNVTAATYNARWVPVRVGTDTAFLLAVMHEMVRLDNEKGNIIDWDFMNERTVGFDMEHMPEDAKLEECMLGYLMGEYDGIEKTPEWASEMCGTPVEDITWFAELCGKQNNVMILHNYAASRTAGAENLPQALMTVGALGGHMGKPGNACACTYTWDAGDAGYRLIVTDGDYLDLNNSTPNPLDPNASIEGQQWWHALKEGKYLSTTEGYYSANNSTPEFHKAREMTVNPKFMFAHQSNFMQSRPNLSEAIEVMRSTECNVSLEIRYSLTAQFADIILPVSTHCEGNDDPDWGELNWPSVFGDGNGQKQRKDVILAHYPLVKPLWETRDDKHIFRDICERLGLDPDELYPVDNRQQFFNYFLGFKYLDKDMVNWKPVITWTEADQEKYGVDNPVQQGEIAFDDFIHQGSWTVERDYDDPRNYIGYRDDMLGYDENAKSIVTQTAWPRPSNSGKLEIYSQRKADAINIIGIADEPIKPYPNYFDPTIGYKDTFSDWENKIKGDYPLQAYTPHYMRRAHSNFDNATWNSEAFLNPVFMNASDAAERGIQAGDTVLCYNQFGRMLRKAQPLQSIMPGCVAIPHGVRSVLDESGDVIIDRGGSEQILNGPISSNYYHHSNTYNSILLEIEKYDGEPLIDDCEREPFLAGTEF